jgi:hypothetical protein
VTLMVIPQMPTRSPFEISLMIHGLIALASFN